MKRRKGSIQLLGCLVATAAAVTVVTGVTVVRVTFGCFPPWSELQLIRQFKNDPLFATGPENGRVVEEQVFPGACSTHSMADDFGGSTTYVTRMYRVPDFVTPGQLRERFGPPAAAAGWRTDERYSGLAGPDRRLGTRAQELTTAGTSMVGRSAPG